MLLLLLIFCSWIAIVIVIIVGLSTVVSAINFITTIFFSINPVVIICITESGLR